jgi:hypothetical protein
VSTSVRERAPSREWERGKAPSREGVGSLERGRKRVGFLKGVSLPHWEPLREEPLSDLCIAHLMRYAQRVLTRQWSTVWSDQAQTMDM